MRGAEQRFYANCWRFCAAQGIHAVHNVNPCWISEMTEPMFTFQFGSNGPRRYRKEPTRWLDSMLLRLYPHELLARLRWRTNSALMLEAPSTKAGPIKLTQSARPCMMRGFFCCAHKAYGKIPQTETVATVLGNNSNRTANLPQASITCR